LRNADRKNNFRGDASVTWKGENGEGDSIIQSYNRRQSRRGVYLAASMDVTAGAGVPFVQCKPSIAICFIVQGWPTKRRGSQPSVPASIRFRRMRDCHSAFSGFGRRGAPEERAGSGFDSCRAPNRAGRN